MKRHLATFEALDRDARSRRLAFYASARSLAFAGADAPSNPFLRLRRTILVGDLIEFHESVLRTPLFFNDTNEVMNLIDHMLNRFCIRKRLEMSTHSGCMMLFRFNRLIYFPAPIHCIAITQVSQAV